MPKRNRESVGGIIPEPRIKFTPGIGDEVGATTGAINRARHHHKGFNSQRRSVSPALLLIVRRVETLLESVCVLLWTVQDIS